MLSYSKGPEIPLLDRTIGEQLELNAKRWPDELAVVCAAPPWKVVRRFDADADDPRARVPVDPIRQIAVVTSALWLRLADAVYSDSSKRLPPRPRR